MYQHVVSDINVYISSMYLKNNNTVVFHCSDTLFVYQLPILRYIDILIFIDTNLLYNIKMVLKNKLVVNIKPIKSINIYQKYQ